MQLSAPPPSVIKNRFHLIQELGRGGYGTVFKAWDTKNSVHVAIKFVSIL